MRRLAMLLGIAVLAGCGGSPRQQAPPAPRFNGGVLDPAKPAGEIALRDQDGRLVRLSSLRGKTVFVTFLYTHCPDICPLIADHLNLVLRRLGPERAGVRVLAVSVDPTGDDHASVRRFVRSHRLLPQFHYLTGTPAELVAVWRRYHIAVQSTPKRVLGHSSTTLLVDAKGRTRLVYDSRFTAPQVLADLQQLASAPS
jgi:protein SCO1/2